MKSFVGILRTMFASSLPVRGAWIEIAMETQEFQTMASLPVRGAWIEMTSFILLMLRWMVAPRAGSVD